MKHPIFYNSEALKLLQEYSKKREEYLLKGIKKEPYEIMNEINKEEN